MPVLATVTVSFDKTEDGSVKLCLDAPNMPQLRLPVAAEAYKDGPTLTVECAGATAGGPWCLATLKCKQHLEGSKWITNYLNTSTGGGRFVNGKAKTGSFALVRSTDDAVVDLGQYPPIFPVIARAKHNAEYKARFDGNYRRLSDFAPFLLVSRSSARFVAEQCQAETYPTLSFRGNIVVDGAAPWAEETWAQLEIVSNDRSPLALHTIKACPRCTVPCRDQTTGSFLFPDKMKLWKVLKKVFPRKFSDPEWGTWAGAFMGVYMGHNGVESKVMVGDTILPTKIVPWDAHLQKENRKALLSVAGVIALFSAGFIVYTKRKK